MSDERIRALERAWKRSGAVDDEARWLQARLRAGELPRGRLSLAAHLGHPAARLALAEVEPDAPAVPESTWAEVERAMSGSELDLLDWLEPIEAWDPKARLLAVLAAARAVLPEFEATEPEEVAPRAALQAARAQLDCPCPEHQATLDAAVLRARVVHRDAPHPAAKAASTAALAAQAWTASQNQPALQRLVSSLIGSTLLLAVRAGGWERVNVAVRAALLPHVLA